MIEIDFSRKQTDDRITQIMSATLNKLQRLNLSLSSSGLAQLLKINKKTLISWEKAQLLFPSKVGQGSGHALTPHRKYLVKDVLRAIVIKHLMSHLGYKKFSGVKLLLEVTNKALPAQKQSDTIDSIHIDRFLMAILNLSIDEIADEKLQANSRKVNNNETHG